MDQVALFSDVRPEPLADDDVTAICDRTRDRVTTTFEAPFPRPRRRRFTVALAGGAVLAAGATAAALILPAGPAGSGASLRTYDTAAYTVRPSHHGTITVTIKQLQDPAGLQRALAADGVAALVRYVPVRVLSGTWHGTTYNGTSPVCQYYGLSQVPGALNKAIGLDNGPATVFWIRPDAMPKGSVVFIQASPNSTANIFGIDLLTSGKLPRCVPVKPPTPQQIVSPGAGQPTTPAQGHQLKGAPPVEPSASHSLLPTTPAGSGPS